MQTRFLVCSSAALAEAKKRMLFPASAMRVATPAASLRARSHTGSTRDRARAYRYRLQRLHVMYRSIHLKCLHTLFVRLGCFRSMCLGAVRSEVCIGIRETSPLCPTQRFPAFLDAGPKLQWTASKTLSKIFIQTSYFRVDRSLIPSRYSHRFASWCRQQTRSKIVQVLHPSPVDVLRSNEAKISFLNQ